MQSPGLFHQGVSFTEEAGSLIHWNEDDTIVTTMEDVNAVLSCTQVPVFVDQK